MSMDSAVAEYERVFGESVEEAASGGYGKSSGGGGCGKSGSPYGDKHGGKGDKGMGKDMGKGKDKSKGTDKGKGKDKSKDKSKGTDIITIESDEQHIKRLESQLAAAEAATAAAEASSAFWRQNFKALHADTLQRVRELRQRAVVVSDEVALRALSAGRSSLQHINQNGGEETSGH